MKLPIIWTLPPPTNTKRKKWGGGTDLMGLGGGGCKGMEEPKIKRVEERAGNI